DEAVCIWQPKPHHTSGIPNALYGGMAACLIDCHGLCTVMAAAYRAEGREIGSEPVLGFVTGSLQVRYLRPTPMNGPLILRARVKELTERKCVVACSIYANGEECVRGEVVGVRVAFNPFVPGKPAGI
ncbi:MAG: PaaI family thioesterase, partial [Chloroflexi bacterium]|nr:PaaI family thioesterase [Chloroflexota bacterium]